MNLNNMKTRNVTFSYGTVKDASLKVPVGPYNLVQLADLIRQSYFEYAFRPDNRCLMSDEVLTSSIGQANFFAGALGGYETRLDADTFSRLKSILCDNDIGMAAAVARYRMPTASQKEVYLRASKNERVGAASRQFFIRMAAEMVG